MNGDKFRKRLLQVLSITPQMVVIAKARVWAETSELRESRDVIQAVLNEHGQPAPPFKIEIESGADPDLAIQRCAEAVSWQQAAVEAIWGLISDGLLLPASGDVSAGFNTIGWKISSGGSSNSSSFDVPGLALFPSRIAPIPTRNFGRETVLSSGDLYLAQLACQGMHTDLEFAAKEAIECFKRGLFSGAVALLGKVSEGAWIELGEALVDRTPDSARDATSKQRDTLASPHTGPMQKVNAVRELLTRAEFKAMRDALGVQTAHLDPIVLWTDLVRGSRNAIHFRATPAVPPTFESVATMLLSAAQHLNMLYRIRAAVLS